MGGPGDLLEQPHKYLLSAPVTAEVRPDQKGQVTAVDLRAIGQLLVEMGGGRRLPDDKIDRQVGFSNMAALGVEVGPGDESKPLAIVHVQDADAASYAVQSLRAAFKVSETQRPQAALPIVLARRWQ